MVCAECGWLVNVHQARCEAKRDGDVGSLAPTSGCGGAACALRHRPAVWLGRQLEMADDLLAKRTDLLLHPVPVVAVARQARADGKTARVFARRVVAGVRAKKAGAAEIDLETEALTGEVVQQLLVARRAATAARAAEEAAEAAAEA